VNCFRYVPAAAFAALACLTSCSHSTKPAVTSTRPEKTGGQLYAVSADSTAFFKRGVHPGEPDQKLPRETLVRLIRPSFGFSKVELVQSKEIGYVASDDIRPANSALIAAASAPKVDPMATPIESSTPTESTTPGVEQFRLNSDDPRLVPPPEDLPPSELPTPPPGQ